MLIAGYIPILYGSVEIIQPTDAKLSSHQQAVYIGFMRLYSISEYEPYQVVDERILPSPQMTLCVVMVRQT